MKEKPRIVKLGTIDLDLVETTPVVFKGKLYRFEYVRVDYWDNRLNRSYFRFVDHDSGVPGNPFAFGYHLGNVLVHEEVVYVTATDRWDGEKIDMYCSKDLHNWERWNALDLPGYGIFNTSLCRDAHRYVMMFEIGKPEAITGVRFTARFAFSEDMKEWELAPETCNYAKDRYTAPHCLRYHAGYYYNFYLEKIPGGYQQYVVRSKDLVHWESSPHNPVLSASEEDRMLANPKLNQAQRERIRTAHNVNNSDIDFCEHRGQLVINYSWGSQKGIEHLAEARFDGTESEFLIGWFPEELHF